MEFANSWPNSLHLCLYSLLIIFSSLSLPFALATHVSCLPHQSSSLLQLKRGFFYADLTSWQPGTDCCLGWEGVSCDKATGHVTALDISNRSIQGNLSAAIFNLTSLQHLNLAKNDFSQNQIPTHGFEKLTMLTYLNLSKTYFFGQIPISIANLTNLISLDLSCGFDCDLKLHEPNLRILVSQFSNLRELYVDGVDISENGTEWCRALSESVPHLQVLSMVHCNLSGPIESSLSQLGSLTVLDLSFNSLQTQIPHYFAEFPLKELLFVGSDLEGLFPHDILHIPTLTKLDLSDNRELFGTLPNFPIKSSLESLVLFRNNFFGSIPDSIGNLRNLSKLELLSCNFSGQIPSSIKKLSKLERLDLSYNSLSGSIPRSLFSLPSLEILDLSYNKLSGQFRLDGSIPWKIYKFSHLEILDLSMNQFSGSIPNSIVWLSSLDTLNLNSNNFNGTFDLNLLGHLSNLTSLYLSDNQLSVEDVTHEQLPLAFPQIKYFGLASCNLSQIPKLLRYVGDLYDVDLSKNQLHGVIPTWIWKRFGEYPEVATLNLSHNIFTSVEDVPSCSSYSCMWFDTIDFSFNKLKGAVPLVDAYDLDYSNNEFSKIPSNYTLHLEQTAFLSLSRNMLTGEIPSLICELNLIALDLSYNNLSGSIPSCIIGNPDMQFLSLRENKFSGILSHHINRSCALAILDLNNNNLEGNLPRSLTKCKDLALLDIGNNHIGGTFPFSLGKLPNLQVIVLRSNRFYGTLELPSNFGKMNPPFPLLRIIDLASNNFNGSLPPLWFNIFKSIQNLSSDAILGGDIVDETDLYTNSYTMYHHPIKEISVTITDKGAQMTLENNLPNLMVSIDLSTNRFTGDIPEAIGELKGIKALNLSHNAFTGSIPHRLGQLTQIESLDLSWNQLSGEIPQELMSLNFLSTLNLSFNHLVGRIPQSKQFLTFENSSFEGNPGLCGVPLSKLCNVQIPGNNSTSPSTKPAEKMTEIVLLGLFIGLGYGTGFAIAMVIPGFSSSHHASMPGTQNDIEDEREDDDGDDDSDASDDQI
ncbi:receptor-like protein 7 [Carex rostrata]